MKIIYGIIAFCVILIVALYIWRISRLPSSLEMHVFDTKGVPSIFIRTPQDVRILINGGANSEIVKYITSIIPFYSRRIDYVFVTKEEGDNVSGLIDIINRYKVGTIIIPATTPVEAGIASTTDKIFDVFMETVRSHDIKIKKAAAGDQITFDLDNELSVESKSPTELYADILFPTASSSDFTYSKASPPEMVIDFSYDNNNFLLSGDATTKIQRYIMNQKNVDVLIVSHSLSENLFVPEFIQQINPKYLIYSKLESKAVSKTGSNKSLKRKDDAFPFILDDHRFNIKEKNTVTVLSDGDSVEVQ